MRLRIEIGRLEGRVRKAILMMLLAVVSSSAVAEWVVRGRGEAHIRPRRRPSAPTTAMDVHPATPCSLRATPSPAFPITRQAWFPLGTCGSRV